jgi:heptosyltransferase-3
MKQLERVLKLALAWVMALLLWRPDRRVRALERLTSAKRVLVVRLDNRVGEALLTTPLIDALEGREVHVVTHQKCTRVLEGVPGIARLWGYDDRLKWLGRLAPGVRALRAEKFEAVIDCGNWAEPSVTALLISRLIAGNGAVIGPAIGPGRALMDLPVSARVDTQSELLQRLHLLSPLGVSGQLRPMRFRSPRGGLALLEKLEASPHAVVNPGGRLDHRRVPREVFVGICRALLAKGRTPVVTWGPGEEPLASAVVAGAPGAVLAPPSNLDELAAMMRSAGLTICNNTGPMHLSVAMQVPTVALFLHMPIERWGHPYPPHQMIDLTALAGSPDRMIERVVAAIGDQALRSASSAAVVL